MKLKNVRAKPSAAHHEAMPDMVMLLKFEMSSCSQEELTAMCQRLVDSGNLAFFNHPLRRTCYDMALGGHVNNLPVPLGYAEMTLDSERITALNITRH